MFLKKNDPLLKLYGKCKKHPKYQAARKPRADCDRCWVIWYLKTMPSCLPVGA